MMVRPDH